MLSVQLTSPDNAGIVDAPKPESSSQVIVQTQTMGICGTDTKIISGAIPVETPRILGHEMVGRVVSDNDARFAPGTRVLADPSISCGWCPQCQHRRPHLCVRGGLMGRDVDGVFAEYVAVDGLRLLPVPENVSNTAAGLLQVLGTCVHALRTVDVFPGDVALVMGLGVAGQLMVQVLAERGATVVGVTRSEEKRQLAARHGAAVVAAPADAAEAVASVTDGQGPSLLVEAVGREDTLSQTIELAATAADIILFGTITGGREGIPYYQLYQKELTLWNPRAAVLEDYARSIELVASGRLSVDEIVTHTYRLDEIDRALESAADSSSLKVLLTGAA